MKEPLLSIILPAYHEEAIMADTMQRTLVYLDQAGLRDKTELVVVAVPGDETAAVARSFADRCAWLRIIEPPDRVGKGRDVRAGFMAARGRYQLFTDADLSTPLAHIGPALDLLQAGSADVVIGRRKLSAIHTGLRSLISQIGALVTRLVLLPAIHDSQCGFKAFTQDAARLVFGLQTVNGWAFDMEVLAIAAQKRLKVVELAIPDWQETRDTGLRGESSVQASFKTLTQLLKIRVNLWKGRY